MNRYFAIVGIALTITMLLVIRAERSKEWVRYQEAFAQKPRCTSDAELKQGEAALNNLIGKVPEVKQVYIKELSLADRCITCHVGIAKASCANEEKPFNTHPGTLLKSHPVEKFGCTTCHGGQGLGTTVRAAHDKADNYQPMLPMRYAYGYCGRCHKEPDFRSAPQLAEGKRLFRELGCPSCHEAKGYEGFKKNGPPLSRIGTKVNREWLLEYLLSPRKYWKDTPMPDFRFKREKAEAIADFLMTLEGKDAKTEDGSEPSGETQGYSPSMESGRKLFADSGCLTCHDVKGLYYDGPIEVKKMGPELTRVATKANRNWLIDYVQEPKKYYPETRMPSFRFTAEEASDLAEYLFSFRGNEVASKSELSRPGPSLVEEGRRFVKDYNCAGCHEIEGILAGKPGPELTDLGNKPSSRLDYGENPPGPERNLANWLYAKVMTPHTFRPDTAKMPYPNIDNPQTDAIVTYLLTLTKGSFPDNYVMSGQRQQVRVYPLGGMVKELFDEFRCLSCHPLGTEGELVGPQLSFQGSRVGADWLETYFEKPTLLRPSLAASMPKLKFTQEERERLAEHASHILLEEPSPAKGGEGGMNIAVQKVTMGHAPESSMRKEGGGDIIARYGGDYKEGKKLFARKLPCIACHRMEGKGGRIGPDLSRAWERLKPEWLYLWLKSPQSFLPDVRMPNFGLSDYEIASLMSYILAPRPDAPVAEERKVLGEPERFLAGGEGDAHKKEEELLTEAPKRRFLQGEDIFMRYCSLCHGEKGDGKGYNAPYLPGIEPRDFTDAEYMDKKRDEDLFRVINGGGMSAGLSFLMPMWGMTLDKEQINEVISYIRRFSHPISERWAGPQRAGKKVSIR